jgi:hypothetical protein
MPRKKSKKNMYFDLDVQDAIVKYNGTKSPAKKNIIYRDGIHYAFDKLAENIINTFKFSYFDSGFVDVKNEVVSFLVMNIHKYDHTKGSKAFSYFSIVAKNYLILHNNNNYKKLKSHNTLNVLEYTKSHSTYEEKLRNEDLALFFTEMIKFFDKKIPYIFKKKKDIDIAYSLLHILKERENIEEFNKKALYILIREMTNVETSEITKVVNVFKSYYSKLSQKYFSDGAISDSNNKFF